MPIQNLGFTTLKYDFSLGFTTKKGLFFILGFTISKNWFQGQNSKYTNTLSKQSKIHEKIIKFVALHHGSTLYLSSSYWVLLIQTKGMGYVPGGGSQG